ncbi:MAG TPA: PD-(D/E)XK nuclease family protein, partial [Treponemataceae bacterium]|nr:PD-(D/E)XK nuclease family protein [Treponemataceae bacterium]
ILHDIQQKGFFNWTKKYDFAHTAVFDTNLITVLKKSIMEYVFDPEKQKIRISPTTLKIYNECPLKWLFSRVLKVTEASLDANLMDAVWIGTIYHEIINRVLEEIKATGICLHLEGENVPEFYIQSFTKHCSAVIDNFPKSCSIDTPMSPLTLEMLKMQKDVYLEKLLVFFTSFCKWFNGCYISSVEEGVSYEPKGKNWFFDGRLDCCLQHAGNDRMDAGKYIVDFKTGTSPSFTESLQTADSDMSDFQLAAYVTLYEHTFTKGRPSVSGAGFFSILKASPTSILGSLVTKNSAHRDQWNPRGKNEYLQRLEPSALGVDFNDSIVQLDVAAQNFAHAVQDENLTHFLQPDFSKISYATCVECPYNSICRTTYTISAEELN